MDSGRVNWRESERVSSSIVGVWVGGISVSRKLLRISEFQIFESLPRCKIQSSDELERW